MTGHQGRLLTRDHSWGNHVLDVGHATEEEVASQPMAQALTRCIGPLESEDGTEVRPDVVVFAEPEPSSRLVLCSDGLWGYFSHAFEMVEAVGRAGRLAPPTVVARLLVDQALARGGRTTSPSRCASSGWGSRSRLSRRGTAPVPRVTSASSTRKNRSASSGPSSQPTAMQ